MRLTCPGSGGQLVICFFRFLVQTLLFLELLLVIAIRKCDFCSRYRSPAIGSLQATRFQQLQRRSRTYQAGMQLLVYI